MKRPVPEGSTYFDKTWGYIMEKRDGKWQRQHRLVMEKKLGRKLLPHEIVHHRNEIKTDNDPDNLELTGRPEHAIEHRTGQHHSLETRQKQSESAIRRAASSEERRQRSIRATAQHARRKAGEVN